jgi:hypothetical protein
MLPSFGRLSVLVSSSPPQPNADIRVRQVREGRIRERYGATEAECRAAAARDDIESGAAAAYGAAGEGIMRRVEPEGSSKVQSSATLGSGSKFLESTIYPGRDGESPNRVVAEPLRTQRWRPTSAHGFSQPISAADFPQRCRPVPRNETPQMRRSGTQRRDFGSNFCGWSSFFEGLKYCPHDPRTTRRSRGRVTPAPAHGG